MTEGTKPAIAMPATIDSCVDQYVKLRDKLKEADDAHKAKTKPAREYLEQLNNHLLNLLNTAGGDSVKTGAGTVYKTLKKSATIADAAAFRSYVIAQEGWDLVDWKANANAVSDFIEAHTAPPPGINYATTFLVGVRRK